jgi:hypothetical protein
MGRLPVVAGRAEQGPEASPRVAVVRRSISQICRTSVTAPGSRCRRPPVRSSIFSIPLGRCSPVEAGVAVAGAVGRASVVASVVGAGDLVAVGAAAVEAAAVAEGAVAALANLSSAAR